MKYELTKKYKDGFSILNITREKPPWEMLINLLECSQSHTTRRSLEYWKHYQLIRDNIPWLINNNFIQEKSVQLKPCPICGKEIKIYECEEWIEDSFPLKRYSTKNLKKN